MCVPETKPNSSGKAASAPAPKLNYFNKMELVAYVYNVNTWVKQEDHLKAILDTELNSALATE